MSNPNILTFSIVTRVSQYELLYRPINKDFLFFTTGQTYYCIEPTFTISYIDNSVFN